MPDFTAPVSRFRPALSMPTPQPTFFTVWTVRRTPSVVACHSQFGIHRSPASPPRQQG